ncbi:MAG TPA: nitrate reductase associated protein [Candidatus Binatia bacterium]
MFQRYRFEAETDPDLSFIPLYVRMKLDLVGIKLALKTWLAFTMEERELLCRLPAESEAEKKLYADYLDALSERATAAKAVRAEPAGGLEWRADGSVPEAVAARSRAAGAAVTDLEWTGWGRFQRYALLKLALSRNDPDRFARALKEFRERDGEKT